MSAIDGAADERGEEAPPLVGWLRNDAPAARQTSPLPSHVPQIRLMSVRRAVSIALRIVDRSGLGEDVFALDRRRTGPDRTVSMRTMLLLIIAFQVQRPSRDMTFLQLARWASSEMSAQDRRRVGLTHPRWSYNKIVATFHAFVDLIDDEDSVHRIGADGVIRERAPGLPTRHALLNRMIGASIPDACPPTPVSALDSTDVETYAAWMEEDLPARSDGDDEYVPDNVIKSSRKARP